MILNGFLLGLSTGLFCISYCLPIYAPILLAESRTKKQTWFVFVKFTLGRFIAYILFGAVVGFLGSKISNSIFSTIITIAVIILSCLLILYALGFALPKAKFCKLFKKVKPPFLFGFLTGINVCPPFLLAMAYTFKSGDILGGIFFFASFFVATTLYIAPFTFLGYLSKTKLLTQIARVAAFVVGLIFLVIGLNSI